MGGRNVAHAELAELETSLWRETTRFDHTWMNAILAPDFTEFGRSGRRYDRKASLEADREPINAVLPLEQFTVELLRPDLALVTYISETVAPNGPRRSNRMSLWDRTDGTWRLRFHQGTPVEG